MSSNLILGSQRFPTVSDEVSGNVEGQKDDSRDDIRDENRPSADVVEAALAMALEGATRDKQWPLVAQLARELEARRMARTSTNVVPLTKRRV